ncbi:hypothetical protein BAE44_0002159, partial [Dichanthelium oligosanthes]
LQGEVVCEICGSGSAPHLIANCARCNAHEHWYSLSFFLPVHWLYCMRVLTFLIPHIWFCYRCQRNANRAPRSLFMQDNVVCEICGSGSRPRLIVNCARCNTYEHWYFFISLPRL